MRNDFYVYGYIRLDTNTYFYIGKGCNNRYRRIDLRKKHFKNIINSTDCVVEIIKDNLTEYEALELERDIIEMLVFEEGYTIETDNFSDKNKHFNHLVNCTFGGEGISGYKHTDETKKKCSLPGEKNGMYGLKGELSPHYGKKFSDDHKNKICASNPNRIQVYCVELNMMFPSIRRLSDYLLQELKIVYPRKYISNALNGIEEGYGWYKDSHEHIILHFTKI